MAEREEIQRGGSSGEGNAVSRFFQQVAGYPKRFRQFLHEVRVELRHVSWPTRDDIKATTVVVLVTIFIFGAFLYVVDRISAEIIQRVLAWFR